MSAPLLIRYEDLKPLGITLSRDTIRRLAHRGDFPAPRRLGHHHIVWCLDEVQAFLAALPVAGPRARTTKRGRAS